MTAKSPVVLQEEPYLSPSFVRNEDEGQGFRHYRDFYHNSDGDLDGEESASAPIRHRSKPKTKSSARLRSRIDIPETIVKDGQIFYRYDAEIDSGRNKKDQSKRSHQGSQEYLEGVDDFAATSDKHIPDASPDILVDGPLGAGEYGGGVLVDHNLISDDYPLDLQVSHVQTQAQMGGGNHAASAGAQMDSGPAVQVQGSATSGGFFSAQAQSMGHQGMSQTQVQGSKHGVQGSAMTHGKGQHSQAQVQMGAHSLSAAQVLSHNNSLSSIVQATQLGGSAGSEAHGHGLSTSHAHMDFHPSQQYHGGSNGLHGQGAASASVSSQGSSSLASLTGDIPTGSYLGTAQSTMSNPHLHHELTQDNYALNADGVHGNTVYDVHETHTDPAGIRGDNAIHTEFGQVEAIRTDFGQGNAQGADYGGDIGLGETAHTQFIHGSSGGDNQVVFTQGGQVPGQYLQAGDVSKQPEGVRVTYRQEGGDISRQTEQGINIHNQFEQTSDIHGQFEQGSDFHRQFEQGNYIHRQPGQESSVGGEGSSQYDRYEERKTGHFGVDGATFDQPEQHSQLHAEFEHENLVHAGLPEESPLQGQEDALLGGLNKNHNMRIHGQTNGHGDLPLLNEDLQELHPIDGSYHPSAIGGTSSMGQDMLGSIMETVHQPDMQPAVASYPASEWSFSGQDYQYIDRDGLHGGAGIPPRESEIEQSSVPSDFEEGDGRSSYDGRTDLATLTHDSLDALPGQGEFHNVPKIDYDYNAFRDYSYEEGDYGHNIGNGFNPSDLDFYPDYIPTEVVQSPYLYPSTAEAAPLPQPAVSPQSPQQPFVPGQIEPELTTPVPRIVVHQVQMSLPQPGDDDLPHTPTQPPFSPQPTTIPTISPQLPPLIAVPYGAFAQPETSQDGLTQPAAQHTTAMQPVVPQGTVPHVSMPAPQHVDATGPHMPAPQPRPHEGSVSASQPESQPPTIPPVPLEGDGGVVDDTQMVMQTIPLPGGPGTTLTLPNVPGSPTINVMAMPASGRRPDGSIQPGEKIPGTRGYSVPSGFRGRVVLGNSISAAGFNGQRGSHSTVYSSSGGPGASQYLTHTQGSHSSSAMSSSMTSSRHTMPGMQRVYSYRQTVTSQNMPMTQSEVTGSASSGKSWGSMMSSGKSWNSKSWDSSGNMECGYFSMNCNVVFGPFKQTKVCKPIHIAKICCC